MFWKFAFLASIWKYLGHFGVIFVIFWGEFWRNLVHFADISCQFSSRFRRFWKFALFENFYFLKICILGVNLNICIVGLNLIFTFYFFKFACTVSIWYFYFLANVFFRLSDFIEKLSYFIFFHLGVYFNKLGYVVVILTILVIFLMYFFLAI